LAWEQLASAVKSQPYFKYFVVPMARMIDNQVVINSSTAPATEEPQIIFRRDAKEEFNEEFPYGRRPKVELFWRLGIPGLWDKWGDDVWDPPRRTLSPEAGQFGYAGWVARLSSGHSRLEAPSKVSLFDRALARTTSNSLARTASMRAAARTESIKTTLDFLDKEAIRLSLDPNAITAYSEKLLQELGHGSKRERHEHNLIGKLLRAADKALLRGSSTLADDGLASACEDRIGAAEAPYEVQAEKSDCTQLQQLFVDTTTLALAWQVSGKGDYAEQAAKSVKRWFIHPETRIGHNLCDVPAQSKDQSNEAQTPGICMRDFYYFLDGVRIIERAGTFDASDRQILSEWLRNHLQWLFADQHGKQSRLANNNHGTCFDLQVLAIAHYLGDVELLVSTMRTSQERLLEQFESNGAQPQEMKGTITAHNCCFNLQTWANLADVARCCGIDFWNIAASDGRGLRRAFEWMAPYIVGSAWECEQTEPFDRRRFIPLYFASSDHYRDIARIDKNFDLDRWEMPALFSPRYGIRPFWMLG
jgi:hypothetical protein